MTIKSGTIREIVANAMISAGTLLLIDPKKKKGHSRTDSTFHFFVRETFQSGGRIFLRGNHIPSNKAMVLDQETKVILN